MPKKSHNTLNMLGIDKSIDDMDIVKQYDLDPKLAYTPEINMAAIEAQHQKNYEAGIRNGLSEEGARKYAKQYSDEAKKLLKMVEQ